MVSYDDISKELLIVCDFCAGVPESETFQGGFTFCIEQAKEKGWLVCYSLEQVCYLHKCPTCIKGPTPQEDF